MSDTLPTLEKVANLLLVHDYINSALVTLVGYNHLLTLDDEVSYVWQRKKSWISYLFILNRYMLLSYAIFIESTTGEYRRAQCTRNISVASTFGMTMLLLSDAFMNIRVYAITGRNRLFGLYLSSLICAKAVVSYYYVSGFHPNAVPLPDIPLAVFRTCTTTGRNRLLIAIHAIGIAFDASVFGSIIWFAYSNAGIFRFSSLLRNVVTDATVYFIMVMCIQTLVLFFLLFADAAITQFPLIFYGVLIPILINRVVLSLKKAADFNNEVNQAWNTEHFSNMRFETMSMTAISETVVSQPPIEVLSDTVDHNNIPLGDFDWRRRPRSPGGPSGVASQSTVQHLPTEVSSGPGGG